MGPPIAFAPRRLVHVNLYVSDLERSVRFYRDVCGLHLVFEEPGIEAAFLSNGNSHHDIALMQASTREYLGRDGQVQVSSERGSSAGLNHLAFELETEAQLVEAIGHARSTGVAIDRLLDHLISRSAYLADPDGIVLECYADTVADWRGAYRDLADQLITSNWAPDDDGSASTEHRYETEPRYRFVAGAPVAVRRTARAALAVSDLADSIRYYTEVVGLRVLRHHPAERLAILAGQLGTPDLLLLDAHGGPTGLHHIGFELADRLVLDATAERLQAAGIAVVAIVDRPDLAALVVRDPDGMLVEFYDERGELTDDVVLRGTDRAFAI